MAEVLIKVGRTVLPASTTGTLAVTGVGFQPKIIWFFTEFNSGNITNTSWFNSSGWAISSSKRCYIAAADRHGQSTMDTFRRCGSDACMVLQWTISTTHTKLDFTSMDSDGFTINRLIVSGATVRQFQWVAFGGDLGAFDLLELTSPTATGDWAITGVGFKPNAASFLSTGQTALNVKEGDHILSDGWAVVGNTPNNMVQGSFGETGVGTSVIRHYNATDRCIAVIDAASSSGLDLGAKFKSMDSDGITLDVIEAPASGLKVFGVFFEKALWQIVADLTKNGSGNQDYRSADFSPRCVIAQSAYRTALNTGGTTATDMSQGKGAVDLFELGQEYVSTTHSRDGDTTSNARRGSSSRYCMIRDDSGFTYKTDGNANLQYSDGHRATWAAASPGGAYVLNHLYIGDTFGGPEDQGPNAFSTLSSESHALSTNSWGNPSNADANDDDVRATCAINAAGHTEYLKGLNPGFTALPSNAIIDGIELKYRALNTTGWDSAKDETTRLVKNGTIQGNDLATSTTVTGTEVERTVGGPTEKWGLTWAASDIDSQLGAVLHFQNNQVMNSETVAVDTFTLRVYYTVPDAEAKDWSDTGSGTESVPQIDIPAVDSGAGVSTVPTIGIAASDTGSGAETIKEGDKLPLVYLDAGVGVDVLARYHNWAVATDSGSGAEALVITQDAIALETGLGSDSVTIAVSFSVVDTGSGADVVPVTGAFAEDGGHGADVLSLLGTYQAYDGFSGSEFITIAVTATDTGSGADTTAGGKDNTATESGFGINRTFIEGVPPVSQETGVGVDLAYTLADFVCTETGTGVDSAMGGNSVLCVEFGTGSDALTQATVDTSVCEEVILRKEPEATINRHGPEALILRTDPEAILLRKCN